MKNTWLVGLYEDEILPIYIGIVINHEIRIPFLTNQDSMESRAGFFFVAPEGHLSPPSGNHHGGVACIRTKSPVKTRPQPRVNKASPVRAMGTCRFFQQMKESYLQVVAIHVRMEYYIHFVCMICGAFIW